MQRHQCGYQISIFGSRTEGRVHQSIFKLDLVFFLDNRTKALIFKFYGNVKINAIHVISA